MDLREMGCENETTVLVRRKKLKTHTESFYAIDRVHRLHLMRFGMMQIL